MVFLFIMLILAVLIILLINSKLKINVKQIKYDSIKVSNNNIDIRIKFIVFGFIPVLWQKIDNKKIEKEKQKNKYKNRFKKILNKIKSENKINSLDILKTIKENINIKIKKFNLFCTYGTENVFFNSIVAPIIATVLTILFCKKQVKEKHQKYQITPIYNSRKFNKYFIFRYI